MAQTQGRRKIEMKKITNEKSLVVTFSKRRSNLFKKASELGTLCGTEMAMIVFSPAKKAYSYGNPSVDTIVDRYQKQNPPAISSTSQLVQHYRKQKTEHLNMQLTNLLDELDIAKKTGETLNHIRKARQEAFWWDAPLETLTVEKLEELKAAMLQLKKASEEQAKRLMAEVANPSPILPNRGPTWLSDVGPSM